MRWSTEPQTWGDSERRQHQQALDWCQRNGKVLSERMYTDRGISGWKGANRKSGALGALLRVVKPGDIILVEDFDRFSREQPLTVLNALWETVRTGVAICSLKSGVVVDASNFNDLGVLTPMFMGATLANAENEKRSFRIREAMASRRKQLEAGKAVRGRLPAWLVWEKQLDKPVVDDAKAKVVAQIFKLCIDGNGCRAIETMMRKVPAIAGRKQAHWNVRFIHQTLTNRAVLGEHLSTGQKVYPAIISEETFYRAAAMLKARKILTVAFSRQSHSLFTGLIKCGCCGASYVRQSATAHGKRYDYVVCSGALHGTSACLKLNGVRYDKLEKSFLHVLGQTELVYRAILGQRAPSKADTIQAELDDVRRQIEKYMKLLDGDENPSMRMVAHLKQLESREHGLKRELEAENNRTMAVTPADEAYERFRSEFAAHIHLKEYRGRVREVLRDIVDRIVVTKGGKKSVYDIHFHAGKMPVTVYLLPGAGWVVSPASNYVLGTDAPPTWSNVM